MSGLGDGFRARVDFGARECKGLAGGGGGGGGCRGAEKTD